MKMNLPPLFFMLAYCILHTTLQTDFAFPVNLTESLEIVSREEWGARPPKATDPMANPVPFVIIHHSYIPPACENKEDCIKAMQWIQEFHQDNRSWNDIGYSFAVGGDGRAYEGRGWSRVGAHAPSYNDKSIGICLIGDWRVELPPVQQIQATRELIEYGVKLGKIAENYLLVTHRQVREGTECPGERLFEEVSTWSHFYPLALPKYKDPQNDGHVKRAADLVSSNQTS